MRYNPSYTTPWFKADCSVRDIFSRPLVVFDPYSIEGVESMTNINKIIEDFKNCKKKYDSSIDAHIKKLEELNAIQYEKSEKFKKQTNEFQKQIGEYFSEKIYDFSFYLDGSIGFKYDFDTVPISQDMQLAIMKITKAYDISVDGREVEITLYDIIGDDDE